MSEPDWEQLWKVERDICFLYHELSEYAGIVGDLAYGSMYALPYWNYLSVNVRQMPDEERCFIRDGCLVMLLAMAWDVLDGSGTHLVPHLSQCQQAVDAVEIDDDKTRRLVQTVQMALKAAGVDGLGFGRREGEPFQSLETLSIWAHQEYVSGYFKQKSAETANHVTTI